MRIRREVGVRTAAMRGSAHDETNASHQAVINYIFLTKGKNMGNRQQHFDSAMKNLEI